MFSRPILPLILLFGLIIIGCRGRSNGAQHIELADTVSADTVLADLTPTMLPDTVYASAEKVHYNITLFDSITEGKLYSTGDAYSAVGGMLTFRGNGFRSECIGRVTGEPKELVIDWKFVTDEDFRETDYGKWGGGTGWTGQPVYIEWPDSLAARFRQLGLVGLDFSGREVIVGSLCSKIYFLDAITGLPSRSAIEVGNPVKGSLSLDPTLNGNLYFGQGIPSERPFGAGVIDLWHNNVSDFTPEDHNAWRKWGAYDASPLKIGQFLFRVGENGTVYKYSVAPGNLTLHSTLRYLINSVSPGIEASMAQWLNYGYIADNHGNVVCININTLIPVWHFAMGDDTDCTPVIAEEADGTYIYIGSEADRRPEGPAVFVKLNALDGKLVWQQEFDARPRDTETKHFDGGFYATSLLGAGNCSHLVFNSCVLNSDERPNGCFVAMDRAAGTVVYTVEMSHYGWMSAVGFLNESDRFYIVVGDSAGYLMLLDGIDGRIINRQRIGLNFESSPAVTDNSLIVGSRGRTIYKVSLQ